MRVNSSHRLLFDGGTSVPFLETPNKHGTLAGGKPKYIIIHYTASGSANSAINVFRNPSHRASAHLVLGHDGAITQMARLNEKCWHAGQSRWGGLTGLNSHSVGIEIANWGWLEGGNGNWKSHVGTRVDDSRVIEATHRNGGRFLGWEIYDEAQVTTCADMVRAIADRYELGPEHVLGHDDISPLRKQDPGPAWHMEKFRSFVFGRSDDTGDVELRYQVSSATGLNLRNGPGVAHDVIKLLSDNTEVLQIESNGAWWLVSELVGGDADITGWVHSNWLRRM
ncbi:N-acetylmuramoyl-L-alanine amidase [Roseovarius sp. EL26]|uniref:N-acetylmuramoyl-L-alanine amidase n=1 Tax=Roseovarius sp. EL26 TaxID=2126672 RepID=UPI000EA16968|nr:N-acetylmuramoyl-L-alanine amidase [Roseovarius sp. EL26]